jgi:hypothetical protein
MFRQVLGAGDGREAGSTGAGQGGQDTVELLACVARFASQVCAGLRSALMVNAGPLGGLGCLGTLGEPCAHAADTFIGAHLALCADGQNAQRALRAISLRNVGSSGRMRPVTAAVHLIVQAKESCTSIRLRSVMSRATIEAATIFPPAPLIGETDSEISTSVPSLRWRTVS